MYYCTNPEKFESDELRDDDYFVSSFYDIYMFVQDEVKKPHKILLKRYSQEEDYMIHRLLKKYIISENIDTRTIVLEIN